MRLQGIEASCTFIKYLTICTSGVLQVTTLHTVLRSLQQAEHALLRRVAELSQRVIVMSQSSRQLLRDMFFIRDRVEVIPHGVPRVDLDVERRSAVRMKLGWSSRIVLVTNGLIHPNKGYERVLNLLPGMVQHRKVRNFMKKNCTDNNKLIYC